MNFLFYLGHPAKFNFHKQQINTLKRKGHIVDVIINTKDILEDLVIEEGWNYTNIFPKSRKIKGVHVYISAFVSLFLSVYRLWIYSRKKHYDVFVGDLLVVLGRLKRVPSFYPTDDVLSAVPEQQVALIPAHYIIAPEITYLGKYSKKKIAYKGYKALAHLHPNHFTPDLSKLSKNLQSGRPYFIIRCTGFGATHDINKTGIDNEMLNELVRVLSPQGNILISSERGLPENLSKYKMIINKSDMSHYLAFATILLSDSTTMSSEAAVLGTPSIEFDEYFYEIDQMLELQDKYGLIHCFRANERVQLFNKVDELLKIKNIKEIYKSRRDIMLADKIDVSSFLTWLFENHPQSTNAYFSNPEIQDTFKKTKYV